MIAPGGGFTSTNSARYSSFAYTSDPWTRRLKLAIPECSKAIRIPSFDKHHTRIQISGSSFLGRRRSCVVVLCSSSSKLAGVKKAAAKGRNEGGGNGDQGRQFGDQKNSSRQSRGETRVEKQTKTGAPPPPPSKASEKAPPASPSRVQEGFAGLAALKTQLEQEKPRTSRPNLKATAGALSDQKRAQVQRKLPTTRSMFMNASSIPDPEEDASPALQTEQKFLILVQNLATQVTQEEYRKVMMSIPNITKWKYLSDKDGLCRWYGYCQVKSEADIAVVIRSLSKQVLHGKRIEALPLESEDEFKQSFPSEDSEVSQSKPLARKQNFRSTSSTASNDNALQSRNSDSGMQSSSPTVPALSQSGNQRDIKEMWQRSSGASSISQVGLLSDDGKMISRAQQNAEEEYKDIGPGSGIVYESPDDGRISGRSVMAAFERAAALGGGKGKSKKKGKRLGARKLSSDSDSDDEQRSAPGSLHPLVFKAEWASQIAELEAEVEELSRLLY